jgi:acetyl esterase/lipase
MNPARLTPSGAVTVFLQSFSLADPPAHPQPQRFANPILHYAPATTSMGAAPIVIDIHGGSWQHGAPQEDEALSRYLAARGYAVFAIDYRRAPLHPHPTQIDDVRQAISWVKSNAGRFHADASRMALVGHSVGGHLAMLAAYAQPDAAIRSVVSLYGPTDLDDLYRHPSSPDPLNVPAKLEALIGLPFATNLQAFRDASPIRFVRPGLPPTLQIQGARDHIVPARLARTMHEELRRAGNRSLLLELPWSEHNFDMVWFGPGNRLARIYIDAFLADSLR